MDYVPKGCFSTLQCLGLSGGVHCHPGVLPLHKGLDDMRTNKHFNKFAGFSWPNPLMESFVNILCDCYRPFFLHGVTPRRYTCTIRIQTAPCQNGRLLMGQVRTLSIEGLNGIIGT